MNRLRSGTVPVVRKTRVESYPTNARFDLPLAPTWAGFIGVERSLFFRAALVVEYRQYRMYWEHSNEDFLEDINLVNHQFDLGLSYALR